MNKTEVTKDIPAFPTEANTQPGYYQHHGMSLRDWFAGMALQGMFASDTLEWNTPESLFSIRSKLAYAMADHMLKEREKP